MMRRQINSFFVNFKGHCFICLEQIFPELATKTRSLHHLSRYVNMNLGKVLRDKGLTDPVLLEKVERAKMKVELCDECASMTDRISVLCQELEKIEMEVNSCISSIRDKLRKAELGQIPNLTDLECELNFDDGGRLVGKIELGECLRTEAMKKCSLKLRTSTPRVRLSKLITDTVNPELRPRPQKPSYSRSVELKSEIEVGLVKMERSSALYDIDDNSNSFLEDSYSGNSGNQEHMEIPLKNSEDATNMDLADCHICHTKVSNLSRHLFTTHLESDTDQVPQEETIEVITKAKTTHPAPICTINPETGKHKCGICSKELLNKYTFQAHYKTAHLQVRYKCAHCEMEFSSQFNLTCHNQAVHLRLKTFKCPKCKKRFANNFALQHHKQRTKCGAGKSIKPFECRMCGKSFTQKGNMQTHMNAIHLKLKRHECKFCGKKFAQKVGMQDHQRRKHASVAL